MARTSVRPANDLRIALPPEPDAADGVATALRGRRSLRQFRTAPLSLLEAARLLRAAQGISHAGDLRTVPSAGALYPLEVYLVAADVSELDPGVYHYVPETDELIPQRAGDQRQRVAEAAWDQEWIAEAPAIVILSGVMERSRGSYGSRGDRYVHFEAGHAGQSIYLQATAMALGTTFVASFDEELIRGRLGLRRGETPLALMPVGRPDGGAGAG